MELRSAPPLLTLSSLLLSINLGAACGDDNGSDGDDNVDAAISIDAMPSEADAAPLSPSCMEASNHDDLAWIEANIFTGCAAFSSCHQGAANSAGGLNLEAGMSEASLLNVPSVRHDGWNLVVPGSPEESYLVVILGGAEGPIDPQVGLMPYNNPALCDPKVEAIRRWISSLDDA